MRRTELPEVLCPQLRTLDRSIQRERLGLLCRMSLLRGRELTGVLGPALNRQSLWPEPFTYGAGARTCALASGGIGACR